MIVLLLTTDFVAVYTCFCLRRVCVSVCVCVCRGGGGGGVGGWGGVWGLVSVCVCSFKITIGLLFISLRPTVRLTVSLSEAVWNCFCVFLVSFTGRFGFYFCVQSLTLRKYFHFPYSTFARMEAIPNRSVHKWYLDMKFYSYLLFYICLSVRTLLCRRQNLPKMCTLFCLVLIK